VIIPYEQVSADALQGLVEGFILRDGTDYGLVEASLEEKVAQVMLQLERDEVQVVFDDASESASLMTNQQVQAAQQPRAATDDVESLSQAQSNTAFDEYSQLPPDESQW